MKFNGNVLLKIITIDQIDGEPDEFAIVENSKAAGGVIPYARYGDKWIANPVPTRPLIRTLVTALKNKGRRYQDRVED